MKNEKKEKIWFGIIVAFSTAIITKLTNSAINNSPVASSLLSEWSIYVFPGAIVILVVSFLIYITMVNDSWRKAYKRLSSN